MKKSFLISAIKNIDWVLLGAVLCVMSFGLATMHSFSAPGFGFGSNGFYDKQLIWITISIIVFFAASLVDWRFLKDTRAVTTLYAIVVILLILLFVLGKVSKGAQSWFSLGIFSFQPVDFAKLVMVLLLAKYFSRRHIEIAHIRHILVSALYTLILFVLVFLQPDFGGAIIIFLLWFAMVLISGISKKHLLLVLCTGILTFGLLWVFVFHPYQKDRILNFVHPLTNIHSSGYNAYQSTVAVGSGQVLGKGIGQGSQSRLLYLPEFQTDFIFAAFAEEWGFVGVILLLILFAIIFTRLLIISSRGGSNFEILFGLGITLLCMIQASVNIGTNIGLLPVTGVTLPFMSYGGSHLVAEFLGLGMLMGMKKYGRPVQKELAGNEIVGVS